MSEQEPSGGLDVRPVTAERWDDLAGLFERRGPRGGIPDPGRCWCIVWRERPAEAEANKEAMGRIVTGGGEPGLLAYRDGRPVGWISVAPRETYGRLMNSPTYRPTDPDAGVYAIVCFYVHSQDKGQGIASVLLDAAVDHAEARGASAVEAYPGDPPDYMGRIEWFQRRGFEPSRHAGKRTIMRLRLPR